MSVGEVRRVKLIDIAAKQRWALNGGPFGSKLTTKHYTDSGVPVIRGTNLSGGAKFSFDDFVYVSEEKADELRPNNAHPGDIIFTQRGTIGQVGLIPRSAPFSRFVISQSQMKLTPDPEQADAEFLYYLFSAPATVKAIENLAFSAGVPHINLEILRNFEVALPSLPEQQRVAEILSAYDKLIENNQRRIRILEEMARALYREWFVEFRFPGRVESGFVRPSFGNVPKEWGVGKLQDVVVLQRGFDLPKAARVQGSVPVYAATGVTGSHNESKASAPGIVTGRSGTIGEVLYVQEDYWPLNTTLWSKEFPKGEPLYAYYLLSTLDLKQFNSGAAVPTLNRNDIHTIPVPIPPHSLQKRFQEIAGAMLALARNLEQQNANLRSARDLLLPWLLSGTLSISEPRVDVSAI